ncbi:mitotic spindle checkpoint kinase Bub1 [Schizosaccharomyces pombe]|uniref:Spindle assembly checkpoint serine/threonine-protein kinase bub1 n=1 Tax=Schizosaccharomyces pombe (strain 972 / ATCC 24843) TaxID=284812 RepID=BUB1_SCHPO|nr:serine/threonine protein kinase Bub1 [Schizosaccharomyces pombe]O94751.1 RecName: Full=Checkpoint serine/threonine-protein kinase bub1 [Schizosaccharomyces pombe 972h-]AAC98348.1 protein kinase Bub1p [Schizosaccharomyces pombe]CAA22865.1 serine/threonine protein kinase Bub1 [Schizosaccharomyces pombe]|eukprot:NP_588140.1 serine/threonine protein kinase Bub1 [Schizosaccharomyces pombe]
MSDWRLTENVLDQNIPETKPRESKTRLEEIQRLALFQEELDIIEELDDPVDVWYRCIEWLLETRFLGMETVNKMLDDAIQYLERCRFALNDVRHLLIQLAKIKQSYETPDELQQAAKQFYQLASKGIGLELALFYEEYGSLLIRMQRWKEASEVFHAAVSREARPLVRLLRNAAEFSRAYDLHNAHPSIHDAPYSSPFPPPRIVLGSKPVSSSTLPSKPKSFQVFSDASSSRDSQNASDLPQAKSLESEANTPNLPLLYDKSSGKRVEYSAFNFLALYENGEERSMEECRAQRYLSSIQPNTAASFPKVVPKNEISVHHDSSSSNVSPIYKNPVAEQSDTPTRSLPKNYAYVAKSTSPELKVFDTVMPVALSPKPAQKPPSPTIHTKAALADILDIFNQPLRSESLEKSSKSPISAQSSYLGTPLKNDENSSNSGATSLTGRSQEEHLDFIPSLTPSKNYPSKIYSPNKNLDFSHTASKAETYKNSNELENVKREQPFSELLPSTLQEETATGTTSTTFANAKRRPEDSNISPTNPKKLHTLPRSPQYSTVDSNSVLSPAMPKGYMFVNENQSMKHESSVSNPVATIPHENGKHDFGQLSPIEHKPFFPKNDDELPGPSGYLTMPYEEAMASLSNLPTLINPLDQSLRDLLFQVLRPSLLRDKDYHEHETSFALVEHIESFVSKIKPKAGGPGRRRSSNRHSLDGPEFHLFYPPNTNLSVISKLGQGAFAPVYLVKSKIETENGDVSQGGAENNESKLFALKIETPPSCFEFYLTRQAMTRLKGLRETNSILPVHQLHMFHDTSHLLMDYRPQGSILDLVNSMHNSTFSSSGMDEILVVFFSIEFLRIIEALHTHKIIHGDLKADNALLRLETVADSEWSPIYSPEGLYGWSFKGIYLIDFGRGIDLSLFEEKVKFIADWDTDLQDCIEMREGRPWTYQIDYHGLAAIIYTMLFGQYIETRIEVINGQRRQVLTQRMKRYWNQDLWHRLFDLLLNPTLHVSEENLPMTEELSKIRIEMEEWLVNHSTGGSGLKGLLKSIEKRKI